VPRATRRPTPDRSLGRPATSDELPPRGSPQESRPRRGARGASTGGLVTRLDLEPHLPAHGSAIVREGGNHAIWKNPANGKVAPIPRHREIKEGTVRAACRQLEIPKP